MAKNWHKWTQEEDLLLIQLNDEGKTENEMAEALGVTAFNVRGRRGKLGLRGDRQPAWSKEEIEILRQAVANRTPTKKIALQLPGRTEEAIKSRQSIFGIHQYKIKRFTPEEDKVIRIDFANLVPVEEIAAKLGRSYGVVRQRIFKLGLRRTARAVILLNRYGIDPKTLEGDDRSLTAIFAEVDKQKRQEALDVENAIIEKALDEMVMKIANGEPRRFAFQEAMVAGATLQQIGNRVGLTRERVRQIIYDVKPVKIVNGLPKYKQPYESKFSRPMICTRCGCEYKGDPRRKYCDKCRAPAYLERVKGLHDPDKQARKLLAQMGRVDKETLKTVLGKLLNAVKDE